MGGMGNCFGSKRKFGLATAKAGDSLHFTFNVFGGTDNKFPYESSLGKKMPVQRIGEKFVFRNLSNSTFSFTLRSETFQKF